ncbi:MAG: TIGR04086 family membrane protein [Oscillospiraceae bacterium]|nr:TIGR04086 family membrane protein [Oscillospiraceae bacterium]
MKNTSSSPVPFSRILTTAVFGSLAGLAVTFLCTFLLSILIEYGSLGEASADYAFLAVIPGALIAGLMTAKRAGRQMLLFGLLGGAVFFLFLLLLSLILLPETPFGTRIPVTFAVCLLSAVLGAIFAPKR